MARKIGRPKLVGKWRYIIRYGNPSTVKITVVKDTVTEVKRRLEKIYETQRDHANVYCTPAERDELISLIQSFDSLRDEDFEHGQLFYSWTFVWGGSAPVTLETTVDRVPFDEEVKVSDGLL